MAALRHASIPSHTRLFPSLVSFSPSKFSVSSLPFQLSPLYHRSAGLHISNPHSASSDAAVTSATTDSPNLTPTSETFDWYSQWYPLAPLCDLDKQAPKALTVLGLDVVIWWDRVEGAWKVFDDRCPHRLAPLSEGRIDHRGRLQCVYHGWCFDGAGACKYIPQAPALGPPVHKNEKACVAVYPSIVQNNILWFWPNTSSQYKDIKEKSKPPYFPELDDSLYSHIMTARDVPYGYEILTENFLDPAHLPYAHNLIFNLRKREDPGRLEYDREGGTPINIPIETSDINGFCAGYEGGYYKFIPPSVIYSPSFMNSSESYECIANEPRLLVILLSIPVSPGKSRVILIRAWNFVSWIDKILPQWYYHIEANMILDSDLYLLHVEERKLAAEGISNWHKTCYVPTKSDAMTVEFRSWLRKYSSNHVNWKTKDISLFPTFSSREEIMDRYWSHVVHCKSCSGALRALKVIKVSLQAVSIALIGILAIANKNLTSNITKTIIVGFAVACTVVSHWLSQFIHKTFYFHDYNHAIFRANRTFLGRILEALGTFTPTG